MAPTSVNKQQSLLVENKTEDNSLAPKLVVNNQTTLEPIGEMVKKEVAAKKTKEKEPTINAKKAKNETVKKTTRKKTSTDVSTNAKKTSTRKTTASKETTVKTSLVVQYQSIEVNTETLIKKAKEIWLNVHNKSEKDIKSIELYIKPEEYSAYYVINNSEKGRVDL